MTTTRQSTHLQIFLEVTGNHWGKDVHKKKKKNNTKSWAQNKNYSCLSRYQPSKGFFRSSGRAMWPTMLSYITAQILRKFHFNFPLLRHGPPSYSFNYYFIFSLHSVGCDCSLTENYQSKFSHFHTETQTKVKIGLSRISTENKKYFSLRDHPLGFNSNKRKRKSLREVMLFCFKKI